MIAILKRHQKGQSLVEYGLLLALISISTIAVFALLGSNISDKFSSIGGTLGNDTTEEELVDDDTNEVRRFMFVFSYTEDGVSIGFSRHYNDNKEDLLSFNFGTKSELQNQIGDEIILPEGNGELTFDYNQTDDTLTSSINGNKISGGAIVSIINSGIKLVFKTVIKLFGL